MNNTIRVEPRDDGWLVFAEDTPIGFISDQSVMTPSGAVYSVRRHPDGVCMVRPDGEVAVQYEEMGNPTLTDTGNTVAWELRPDWRSSVPAEGVISMDWSTLTVRPYSLEEAQGEMPARVKLLLAYLATPPEDPGGETTEEE